jgi:SAM-dependent methyltransferase
MAADGPAFYDDDTVFATYQAHRRSTDNPNDTMEGPTIADLVGDVRGLRILDLGCGAGSFGRELLDRGASAYVGVEGSRKMAAAAREELEGTAAVVVEEDVETWSYPPSAFDVTVARLVLHYVAELGPLFDKVARTLVPGGRFIFSVEHPVITSCSRGWSEGTPRSDWIVDDYFATGERVTSWLGGEVRKYHRTVEDYFAATRAAGFVVDQLREARPRSERFADVDTYRRRTRIPLFLVLAGRKGLEQRTV